MTREHSRDSTASWSLEILAALTTWALPQSTIDKLATPRWDSGIAKLHLRTLRVSKLDKDCIAIVTLPKCGSTLLCYVTALVNTRNAIQNFRNDFDLVPMLSFPARQIAQNFNARQDGIYQLYKINGRLLDIEQSLREAGIKRQIWMSRDFPGYFRSWFAWSREFVPRSRGWRWYQRYLDWDEFKRRALEKSARFHIDELWFAYSQMKEANAGIFFLTYDDLTKRKDATVRDLFRWLGIEADDAMVAGVAQKTSKEAMAVGNRFDPLAFGDGEGISKVNLGDHAHQFGANDLETYDSLFRARFGGEGIKSYQELMIRFRESREGCKPLVMRS